MFWAYVLENECGKFYIGSTDNLERRVEQHNAPDDLTKFTHKNGPWKLVRSEPFALRTDAVRREREPAVEPVTWRAAESGTRPRGRRFR